VPDIQDFICGGYFITKYVRDYAREGRPELPCPLVSLSRCVNDNFFPDDWAIDWMGDVDADSIGHAASFGIDPAVLPAMSKEIGKTIGNEIGFPNVCRSLNQARALLAKYHLQSEDLLVLGIGLAPEFRAELLAKAALPKGTVQAGVYEMITSGQALSTGATVLGSDLVNLDEFGPMLQHSFLCNSLEKKYRDEFDITLNQFGLIADHDAACKCAILTNDVKTGAEPGYWAAWRIVSYPLS
jgi:hypothetical protein